MLLVKKQLQSQHAHACGVVSSAGWYVLSSRHAANPVNLGNMQICGMLL
jgi:hypothetical protein